MTLCLAATAVATLVPAGPATAAATDGAPAITALMPQVSPVAGGAAMRIYGSGFEGTTGVTIGGVAVPDFAVVDGTLLTVTTPAGAPNVFSTIVVTDNQGSGSSPDDNSRVLYTDSNFTVTPDTGLNGGSTVSLALSGYIPNAGLVGLQINPLVSFIENAPNWGGGPPPYAVPKVFGSANPVGSYGPANMVLENPFVGSKPGYDPNNICPVSQAMVDHGIARCWAVLSGFGAGSLERTIGYSNDPTPAAATVVLSDAQADTGATVSFSGLNWGANPYFGSATAPDDPGETPLLVELCNQALTTCAAPAGSATVSLTRYFDDNPLLSGVQPRFSGAQLSGSIVVDNASGCAPSCVVRARQQGYDYPSGGTNASFVTATAPLTVTATAAATDRIITTVAGNGTSILSGDGGPATLAGLDPNGIAMDGSGNLYIAEMWNHVVRKVDPAGTITTVAGNGTSGFSGDGGPATQAQLYGPADVSVDGTGNLYIADSFNDRIRKVDPSGLITTAVGGARGFSGDGGAASAARISVPGGVTVDGAGGFLIADGGNQRVRRVAADGTISTLAGTGQHGYNGDNIPATLAWLYNPADALLVGGDLYIADTVNHRVRKVDSAGTITTVAGTGVPAYGGDGGAANLASLFYPTGLAVADGNLYIADSGNSRIRMIDQSGVITSVVGTTGPSDPVNGSDSCQFAGDGGPATTARLCGASGVLTDGAGNLVVTDGGNRRIRMAGRLLLKMGHGPDPVPAGGPLTYSLRAENHTAQAAPNATIIDTLPAGSTFRSASPSQGSCSHAAGTVECALGALGSGGAATVTITVAAPSQPGSAVNVARLTTGHSDQNPLNKNAAVRTTVGPATLQLTKSAAPDPVPLGGEVTYTLGVFNALATPTTDVTLVDPLPPEVTFKSVTSTQGSCSHSSGTVTCQLGGLDYQASAGVTIVVTPTASGSFTNTATVRSTEYPQGTAASATSSVSAVTCGQTITTDTVLTADVGPCGNTHGIIIGADNITLDLGGHRVLGFPGPADGNQAGIRIPDRAGVTVKNGTVSGFDAGLYLSGGGGKHVISGLTIRDNLGPDDSASYLGDGIYVENTPGVHIVGNTISNNGIFDGIGLYGARSAGATIENNIVDDSRGPSMRGASYGQGIIINAFVDETDRNRTVQGMTIVNNTIRRSDSAGISSFNNTDGTISGNTVLENGRRNANGHGIGVQLGPGAPPGGTRLLVENNEVHGNGLDGIHVAFLAVGNRILNNDAAHNDVSDKGSFDLHDLNATGGDARDGLDCAGNIWSGNTWGSGGYAPACTTTGGAQAPITNRPIADFDGDGATDISVFRASTGSWFPQGGTDEYWGTEGDVAVPGDYDGVAGSDVAVFRPSTGTWFVKGGDTTAWGTDGDLAVPGDYDGDGKDDIAVFRPATGSWYIHPSGGGPDTATNWGTTGDIPVPGDYDANGTTDIAVFRPSTGSWYVQGGLTTNWGTSGDIPVPGDYDGDGDTDIAVFRPSSGNWFVQDGLATNWGTEGDVPVPGDYDGDGGVDVAVFRPSTGTWFVRGGATTNWGTAGDQPLPLAASIRMALF